MSTKGGKVTEPVQFCQPCWAVDNSGAMAIAALDSSPFRRRIYNSGDPLVQGSLWHQCLQHLEKEVPEQQFNTWVRPLQAVERDGELHLLAPNRFVVSWIENNLYGRIAELIGAAGNGGSPRVRLEVGSRAR